MKASSILDWELLLEIAWGVDRILCRVRQGHGIKKIIDVCNDINYYYRLIGTSAIGLIWGHRGQEKKLSKSYFFF